MAKALALGELTRRLRAYARGEEGVEARLIDDVYPLLRRHARRLLAREPRKILAPTELANEAYLKIFRGAEIDWQDSAHFRAIAALTLRRILAGLARERGRQKRGSGALTVSLQELDLQPAAAAPDTSVLDLEDGLTELAELDPSAARIVELRFYGGLNVEEVAACCDLSAATVGRRWRFARAWLRRHLEAGGGR